MDKNEKYLKSIDNTLSDILKELKRQGRTNEISEINIKGKDLTNASKYFDRDPSSEKL